MGSKMQFIFILILLLCFLCFTEQQKFTEESPYLILRLMDLKLYEWKSDMLTKIEKVLDAELKYTDEKKGIACKSIFFEQEPKYPKIEGRFLDISFRGFCIDETNTQYAIDKDLITKAIIRRKDEMHAVTTAVFYRIGNVQLYARNRNQLNLIIIPVSIGSVCFLFILTFCLRQMRAKQKRAHIIAELQKKKEATIKKAQAIANVDPHASDKQRLLQLDPTVVGNVSDTMGSSKEFTNERKPSSNRNNATNTADNRLYNRNDEVSFQPQTQPPRPIKPSRERMHVSYENETQFSPNHPQYHHEPNYSDMVSMQEQQPRVVVRSVRDDGNYPLLYQPQPYDESSQKFVSIPVQVEHSTPYQRFVSTPYHSDPYYPHKNS